MTANPTNWMAKLDQAVESVENKVTKLTQTRFAAKKPTIKSEVAEVPNPGPELLDSLKSGRDYLDNFRQATTSLNLEETSQILTNLLTITWRHRIMLPRVLELCYETGSLGRRVVNEFLLNQDNRQTIGLGHLRVILNSQIKLDSELVEIFQLRLENKVMEILELQGLLQTPT